MKKTIAIIGGGSAAMLIAAKLDSSLFNITIYEKNAALGRKFLVAGKGGFNLTHSEDITDFITRYTPSDFLKEALTNFSNNDLQDWLNTINIPTFIGSSKRVYPEKGIKPIEVFNAIIQQLEKNQVAIKTQHNWSGWDKNNDLTFKNGGTVHTDITIFALGGSSWEKTGSDGTWVNHFKEKDINIIPFQASNCAYRINWKTNFINKTEGKPLKNIAISCGEKSQKGEVVITQFGLEGGAIYALSPQIREQLNMLKSANIFIDLKPNLSISKIESKLSIQNITAQLSSKLKLEKSKIQLLKHYLTKEQFLDLSFLSKTIKAFPLEITALAPIDEAISTVGGIALTEIDTNFQVKKIPNTFVIGEMLDYDAPTGGYLLQSCFSMGAYLASHLNKKY